MAQFDVHRNTGTHKDTIPFVVIVQSAQFDAIDAESLFRLSSRRPSAKSPTPLYNPAFKTRGTSVVLHPLEIVSVSVNQLGALVASLGEQGQLIVAALDELVTRACK
jgi:toxin CcdB